MLRAYNAYVFTRISILVEHSWPLVELASDSVTRETNETLSRC